MIFQHKITSSIVMRGGFTLFMLLFVAFKCDAIICSTANGGPLHGTSGDYTLDLISSGGEISVDPRIRCEHNTTNPNNNAFFEIISASVAPQLQKSNVIAKTQMGTYPLPITSPVIMDIWYQNKPFTDLKLVFSWDSKDSPGLVFRRGDYVLSYRVRTRIQGTSYVEDFRMNIYARNDLIIPAKTCDVNTNDSRVTLGDYPIDISDKNIDISVRCSSARYVNFTLNGQTDSPLIFSNIATQSPAEGIGVQILRNGLPLDVGKMVNLGRVDSNSKSLNLRARYVRNNLPLKAGNVRSVIGVSFTYN